MLFGPAKRFASLVKLSHTVFGLPFCAAAALLADRAQAAAGENGLTWAKSGWILLAFTAARACAMAFNRVIDRDFDAKNPRTASREIPAGLVSPAAAWGLVLGSAGIFVTACAALGPLPLKLAGPCLVVVCGYSLFKRFSWAAHLFLGVALSLAPGGAWIAVRGAFVDLALPVWMMFAVATWVAGFDVLYSLQDRDFDAAEGLHSIPARFGVRGSLWISGGLHLLTVGALVGVHVTGGLGPWHAAGAALIAAILLYEHWIVRPSDLARINRAFFDLNGYISLAYFAAVVAEVLSRAP